MAGIDETSIVAPWRDRALPDAGVAASVPFHDGVTSIMSRYSRAVRTTRWLALCVCVSFSLSVAHAADEFKVSATEMQTLGVTLQRLDGAAAPGGMSFPARVGLPPQNEQVLSAPVAGMVDHLMVSENQAVKAGEPLLSLASPDFGDLQLKWMEAASAQRLAQQTLAREKSLFAEGIIPERRVSEATAAAVTADARARQSRAALQLAGMDDAAVQRLAAGEGLQQTLTLRAKAPVTVLSLQVKPGQRVETAEALLHMANLDRLWLDIDVPAARLTQWATDGTVTVPQQKATARILSVGTTVSPAQTITVRAEVTEGAERLRPGEYVQASLPASVNGEAWTLPIAAVARQGNDAVVFVRTPDGFAARPVTVVSSAGKTVTVTGALKANEQIAVTNVIALKAAWLGESGGE